MRLGVLSEQGGSIANLAASGQGGRFVSQYLARYAAAFQEVLYFSYADEAPAVPPGVRVVPNTWRLHRWIYAFLLPVLQARRFRSCAVLRVMQLTGEVPAIVAKLLYGVPFVATYGYDYARHAATEGTGRARTSLFAVRNRLALRFADRVIVTNPHIRASVERAIGRDRVLYIPNAVDTAAFAPAESGVPPAGPLRIVFVGRLSPQKNLPMLIDAVAALGRPAVVRLIGSGPLCDMLREHAARTGVTLELPGVIPHEALPSELRAASVFVLPSSIEGHPKALLEAMSCGCVCVGTNVEGIRDVIHDGRTGLLSEPTTIGLRRALERALDDGDLRRVVSSNARTFIVEHYDIAITLSAEIRAMQSLAKASA